MSEIKIFINAKPEQVFHVMTDPELSKQWLEGKVETIPLNGPLNKPGAQFKQRFLQGKKWTEYNGHVTEFEEGRLFAAEIDNGPFLSQGKYVITPSGSGAELSFSLHFKGKTLGGKILSVVLEVVSSLMCRQQTNSLKKFVEAKYKN